MILLDQVAQTRNPVRIVDAAGERVMPGAADSAAAARACALRLVLDANAARVCADLANDPGVMTPDNRLVRMPASTFWLEWAEPDGLRTGLLVEADEGGRRGQMETFWEREIGEPDRAQARVLFDLDGPLAPSPDRPDFVLYPGEHALARHLLFRIDPRWAAHFALDGFDALRSAAAHVAASVTSGIGMLCALTSLLSTRAALTTDAVDRARLNRERARRGRAPLLDHVQVRLDLSGDARAGADAAYAGVRGAARLHHVRGHFVQRNGGLFWRRPHLRGAIGATPLRRTVLVTHARA